MQAPELYSLRIGNSVCTVCPALGGGITQWSAGAQDILRRTDDAAIASGDVLSLASFPLVPFSNRIGYGRFIWQGRSYEITRNFPPMPHAHHGTGWMEAWQVTCADDHSITMKYHHIGDARWPWSFIAVQHLELRDDGLHITQSADNLTDETVPLAFGIHPYFNQKGARLSFAATHVLMNAPDGLPTNAVTPDEEFDFGHNPTHDNSAHNAALVTGRDIDHCYAGWNGRARISWQGQPFALEIHADMSAAVVYIPAGGAAFCFEPVPHINNAINRTGDMPNMPAIAPREKFTATVRLLLDVNTAD
jgi:aldose 1-epimerase